MARGKKARRVSTRLRSSTGASAGHTQPQSLSPEERHGLLFSLPIELLSEIVFHVSTDGANRRRLHTLANLASTCRRLYDIVAPVLYKSVFLGRDERRKKRNLSDLLSFCEAILGDFGVHLYVQVLDITELKFEELESYCAHFRSSYANILKSALNVCPNLIKLGLTFLDPPPEISEASYTRFANVPTSILRGCPLPKLNSLFLNAFGLNNVAITSFLNKHPTIVDLHLGPERGHPMYTDKDPIPVVLPNLQKLSAPDFFFYCVEGGAQLTSVKITSDTWGYGAQVTNVKATLGRHIDLEEAILTHVARLAPNIVDLCIWDCFDNNASNDLGHLSRPEDLFDQIEDSLREFSHLTSFHYHSPLPEGAQDPRSIAGSWGLACPTLENIMTHEASWYRDSKQPNMFNRVSPKLR